MKYLNTFKIFESSPEEVKDYLNDIFLDLKDEGFKVEIHNRWIRYGYWDEKHTGYEVEIKKITFLLKDVYECILTSKRYLKENGFFITDIEGITLDEYGTPGTYNIDLYESDPEKYKLFKRPFTSLKFTIRKNK